MNRGIIQTALTRNLPLELNYREPAMKGRDLATYEADSHYQSPSPTDEFASLLQAL